MQKQFPNVVDIMNRTHTEKGRNTFQKTLQKIVIEDEIRKEETLLSKLLQNVENEEKFFNPNVNVSKGAERASSFVQQNQKSNQVSSSFAEVKRKSLPPIPNIPQTPHLISKGLSFKLNQLPVNLNSPAQKGGSPQITPLKFKNPSIIPPTQLLPVKQETVSSSNLVKKLTETLLPKKSSTNKKIIYPQDEILDYQSQPSLTSNSKIENQLIILKPGRQRTIEIDADLFSIPEDTIMRKTSIPKKYKEQPSTFIQRTDSQKPHKLTEIYMQSAILKKRSNQRSIIAQKLQGK